MKLIYMCMICTIVAGCAQEKGMRCPADTESTTYRLVQVLVKTDDMAAATTIPACAPYTKGEGVVK